jgi:apolipoprotein N-acyltransferase
MNRRTLLLSIASGLLITASFPPFDIYLLAWVGLVPLLIALKGQDERTGFFLGAVTGLAFFIGTVFWVTNSIHFYGGIPLLPASLITLLLCAYLALYPALFGAIIVCGRKKCPASLFILAPAVWTALELARTYVFSGFPWVLLGYSQYRVLPMIQIANITGVYGVSFLIMLVNTAIAEFIMDRKKYRGLIAAGLLLFLTLGYGFIQLREPQGTEGMRVSLIQGNIEQDRKWDPLYQSDVIAAYKRLTREALAHHPDLIIWPETAVPFFFGGDRPSDRALTQDLRAFVNYNKVPLLFGSPTFEVKAGGAVHLRNSAFLLDRQGNIDAAYSKHHLVPFGEYVPLKSVLFFIEKMVQAIGDFQPGKEYTLMTIRPEQPGAPVRENGSPDGIKVSVVICYEIIFPDLVRKFVDRGADVMTTVTNDAWFGRTSAPYQHFSMAVLRAVENHVPVARAANTGISGFIDSNGRILEKSDIFTEAHLTSTVIPSRRRTFYTRHGDLFAYACLLMSIVMLGVRKRK